MWFQIGSIATLGAVLNFALYYRDWMQWDKDFVLNVRPGPCTTVLEDGGAEDIVHIGEGKFLITTGFGFGKLSGEIATLNVNGTPVMVTANLTNIPEIDDFLASPHGMSTWRDPKTGKLYVYVLTHPKKEDRIEVFGVETPYLLRHVRSITDPLFTYMNDLVLVGRDKFYITKYLQYRDTVSIYAEHLSHLRLGKIMYYDGKRAREVSSGHFLPNGINASPNKKIIYVAEFGGQTLKCYRREKSNNLTPLWEKHLGSGIDNIDVDEKGHVWIGSHPLVWRIMDFMNIFGVAPASQVIRVKIKDYAISEIEEIYADDGRECSGSTSGVYAEGKLVVGTVFKQAIVCDVKYLTK